MASSTIAPVVVNTLGFHTYQSPWVVLLATDGTGYANSGVETAVNMVRHNGGKLIITYFADPNDVALFDGFPCHSTGEWREYGRRVLEYTSERARASGLEQVETVLLDGPMAERLPDLAARLGAEVIVVASHLFGKAA
ncbi:MAG TPA: universal stress protein [Chloroflexia bacterium]|nr:universal stress protein [Chloroflexia bacterium]